jgi:hypothetical protein
MPKSRMYFAIPVLLLLVGISFRLAAQDEKSPNEEERAKAVNIIRLINTAEVRYSAGTTKGANDAHGRYASWVELYNSGLLKSVQDRWPTVKDLQISASPELMPGYQLVLLVPTDGKSYSVALHDKRDGDGLFSVFSDQNGTIFLGSPLQ